MLKRVCITIFIFFFIMIGSLFLIDLVEPITLLEVVISVILGINFYLVVLRIYTKDYGFSILSIVFVILIIMVIAVGEAIDMTVPVLRIGFHLILAIVEIIVAKKQSEIYEDERFWRIEEEIDQQLGTNR